MLFRELLCWTYQDITSLKLNAVKSELKSDLSPEARQKLKDWLWGDYMLYDHFKAKLETTKREYGVKRLEQEMQIFKTANEHVQARCVEKEVDNSKLEGKFHSWSNDVRGYQVGPISIGIYQAPVKVNKLSFR